ncbi:MAG: hypothetical protein AABX03_01785 [Nanoarchaeota archaeon]
MLYNYSQLVEKISKASGLSVEEVDRKVEAKCAKLSGLISKEGSAQIIASELGISFEKEKMKVNELGEGMKKVNVVGKIVKLNPIREYNKNGKSGKIGAMTIADDTGNIRMVLWDTNHISLFEEGKIKENDVVEISNGAIKNDELHLSGFSDIKLSKEIIDNVILERKVVDKKISELKSGDSAKVRAFIVQVFEPKFFEVCPQCNKKAVNAVCEAHGSIVPVKRSLLSIVIDDGSENIRAVLFSDQIKEIGLSEADLDNFEVFNVKKQELIGSEFFFNVNVRNNKLFNTMEVIINNTEKLNMETLISNLR